MEDFDGDCLFVIVRSDDEYENGGGKQQYAGADAEVDDDEH